ncbi:MAG: hypothetical protein DRQ78_05615 [Epsilonproteobacteria bacterium]|nr:MAG: hypothetical protein DRQ78_05615 [Campylobacterota bacterium]
MSKKSSKIISGVLAFSIYLLMIFFLIMYFNVRSEHKTVHYVKKDENRIKVAFSSPAKTKETKETKEKISKKPKEKIKKKKKKIVKKKIKEKPKKKIIKEKIVKKIKKKKDENLSQIKKINKPKNLFADIDTDIKPKMYIEVSEKPSKNDLVSSSLKIQKSMDTGIENAYLSKIEEKLKGWPAQSEYAGEMAKVWFKIQTSGRFEFKVISASANDNFNTGLIAYLKQLQGIGFGYHKANRAYELDVEFVATE